MEAFVRTASDVSPSQGKRTRSWSEWCRVKGKSLKTETQDEERYIHEKTSTSINVTIAMSVKSNAWTEGFTKERNRRKSFPIPFEINIQEKNLLSWRWVLWLNANYSWWRFRLDERSQFSTHFSGTKGKQAHTELTILHSWLFPFTALTAETRLREGKGA